MKALNQNTKTPNTKIDIRQCGVNLNRWWPVAHIDAMPKSNLRSTRIGTVELLVVKQKNDTYAVFEDACPHKRVRLSTMGQVKNKQIQCQYHGWRFSSNTGDCSSLEAMPGQENRFNLKPFPSQVYAGWVWAFPGDPVLADQTALPHIPPANNADGYYRIPMEGTVNCHYSFITENATDLFHAELHQAQQPWANPRLISLEETNCQVLARYQVDTPNPLARLFTGNKKEKFIFIRYEYPYIHIYEEGGGFYLFVTYIPTQTNQTSVFSTFYFPHILPWPMVTKLLLPVVEPILLPILNQGTFRKVFLEDIRAVEEEQRAYSLHQSDLSRDTNPVTHAVRRVLIQQSAEQEKLSFIPACSKSCQKGLRHAV
jgi:phenylpropionate dioxygenase-like ring-hydroxylating dioxygenase large terminal subunit